MFIYERPVRFEEVDAAQIVFFPRILGYGHEALARLMDQLPGGYSELINKRRIGLPTVHLEVDFTAPLRFGDVARIELRVTRIGRRSCALQTNLTRMYDGVKVAAIASIHAVTDLSELRAIEMPDDLRLHLDLHGAPA